MKNIVQLRKTKKLCTLNGDGMGVIFTPPQLAWVK